MELMELYNYWIAIGIAMIGLYAVIANGNLVKKIIGLSVFQSAVFILYISFAKISGGTAPIVSAGAVGYSNPLPHVLILTAIVVGVATAALALALVVRIYDAYSTIEESEIETSEIGGSDAMRQ